VMAVMVMMLLVVVQSLVLGTAAKLRTAYTVGTHLCACGLLCTQQKPQRRR
jgi:hypothetical protein